MCCNPGILLTSELLLGQAKHKHAVVFLHVYVVEVYNNKQHTQQVLKHDFFHTIIAAVLWAPAN